MREWKRRLNACSAVLPAADHADEVNHQRDRGSVVERLPARQRLPGPEVDGKPEHGA
jgi:hypothetical protein